MLNLGLVSVSFRELGAGQIISLCRDNGLRQIEWGGDIHVPHGDLQAAREVYAAATAAGLQTAAYGSYYRIGREIGENPDWQAVLDTAAALHAPIIRIWACDRGSAEISDELFSAAAAECRAICAAAATKGITVCAECHPNTLTDDYHATLRLLEAVDHPTFRLYWQPNQHRDLAYNLEAIRAMRPYITNVHTFYWEGWSKLPIQKGAAVWAEYLRELQDFPRAFLFEFMPNGRPEELPGEIAAFKTIAQQVAQI